MSDTPTPEPVYIISIGTAGEFTDDSASDISGLVNAEIAAAPAGDHIKLIFNPGTYAETGPILIPSNTSVVGDNATLMYLSQTGGLDNFGLIANADAYSIYTQTTLTTTTGDKVVLTTWPTTPTATGSTPDIIDSNISIQGLTFILNNAHVFGTWFTNATNIDVQNNTYIGGVDGNAFVNVTDSIVAQNIGVGQNNAAWDNWNGPTNIIVELNADLLSGTSSSGWSVLMNSTPTGDPSNPGNAVNDGIVANLFASSLPYSVSVAAYALTVYGPSAEYHITEQGNTDSMMGLPGQIGINSSDPIFGLTVQDDVFSGVTDVPNSGRYASGITVSQGSASAGGGANSTMLEGNLVAGDGSLQTTPAIENNGNSPSTVNNAIIGAVVPANGTISTETNNGTLVNQGNISFYNGVMSGGGVIPNFDITAPSVAFAPADIAFGISGISINDSLSEGTLSVTLLTNFGSLTLGDGYPGILHTQIDGQNALVLSGLAANINDELSELTFTSNTAGWDDAIEVSAVNSLGSTAVRYLPIIVTDGVQGENQLITLTPGEVPAEPDPFTFASTVSLPNLSTDTVIASSGQHTIIMGNTVSVVLLGSGNNTILGGGNQGYITTGSGDSLISLDSGGDLTVAGGPGVTTIVGSTGNNLLEGGVGNFIVSTGVGSSTVLGGLGNVSIQGGTGSTLIETLPQDAGTLNAVLGPGSSSVFALSGIADIYTNPQSHNIIFLGIGVSSILSGGQDAIYLGVGTTTVDASAGGDDTLYGGSGALTYIGGPNSALIEPAQSTTLIAGFGNLTVTPSGNFDLELIDEGNTSRLITLPSLSDGITLAGFPINAIAEEFVDSQNTLHVGLSDGSMILIDDPYRDFVTDVSNSVQFVSGAETPDHVSINVNSLPNFEGADSANNAAVIEQAIASLPIGAYVTATLQSAANVALSGTLNLDPILLTVNGPLAGSGQINIDAGSALILTGSVASTEVIGFENDAGSLVLQDPSQFAGTITAVGPNSIVDLRSMPYETISTVALSNNNVLMVSNGDNEVSLQLDRNQSFFGTTFHIFSDGLNGTDVSERTTPCLLRGTRVSTPLGDVFVEKLKIGDCILSEGGAALKIKWIGRRSYTMPLPQSADITPIRIKASAISDSIPNQDLLVSPRHGIKIDRWIVPAGALVNGRSILMAVEQRQLEYFHIETERHEIIIAHNLAIETYADTNSRNNFDNVDEYYELYKYEIPTTQLYCLPRLEAGEALEAIRQSIARRAGIVPEYFEEARIIGFLEIVTRDHIAGWVVDKSRPGCTLIVEILNCGAVMARTFANLSRPDVSRAGCGGEYCGFSISLPAPLQAIHRHEISVRVEGTSLLLDGSPVVIDPALSHDLIRAEGLHGLLEATRKSLVTHQDVAKFATVLDVFTRRVAAMVNEHKADAKNIGKRRGNAEKKTTVLILDEFWPKPLFDAGSNAVLSHIRAFQQMSCHVIFCATGQQPMSEANLISRKGLLQMGIECLEDSMVTEDAIRRLSGVKIDFVYMHRLAVASNYGALVRCLLPSSKIIYCLAELHYLRLSRHAELINRPDLRLRALSVKDAEIWAMRLSDCIISHSSHETRLISELLPKANIHLVPWSVERFRKKRSFRATKDLAFIGGAGHSPNVDAVKYLASFVMPWVWRTRPEIKCYIIGSEWSTLGTEDFDKRIIFMGQQTDLRSILTSVRITIAPLRFGAGIKGKVLDSLACGTPCVMTCVAAEGIPLDMHLRDAVVEGTAFGDKVVEIYSNAKLWRVLSQSGLDMIETYFSESRVRERLSRATGIVKMTSAGTRETNNIGELSVSSAPFKEF